MLRETPKIESPCKLICEMDLTSALCKGCGRTREEIAMWTRYSDVQRQYIMTELAERLETPKGDSQTPKGDSQTPKGDSQTPKGDSQAPKGD